ncbi:MAG: urease accessory protein UreF [Gammaproteobacteria bacterium]
MIDPAILMTALQHGDSFFPCGAVSFSWGLETLCSSGRVTADKDVESFVRGQLSGRWKDCDRAALLAAHRAAEDLARVAVIDRLLDAQTLSAEMRDGSRRTGAALLAVHEKLKTPRATDYRQTVINGGAPGHLPVVQGMLWRALDIPEQASMALSAHGLCIALLGAALRLGVVGHVDAQRILSRARRDVVTILEEDPPGEEAMHSFAPEAEIAMMRHENEHVRLFAN